MLVLHVAGSMESRYGAHDDQRARSDSFSDSCSRAYPAIDAVLQRKAAIVALQQKLKKQARLHHSELHVLHDQAPLGDGASVTVASNPQIRASAAEPVSSIDTDQSHSSASLALLDPIVTAAADDPSNKGQQQQQPVQLAIAAATPAEATNHQHSTIAGKAAADVQLYAEEFARLRQRHQQRTAAATTIQAAVRGWLAKRHAKRRQLALDDLQDQYADRPHAAAEFACADSFAASRLETAGCTCALSRKPKLVEQLRSGSSSTSNSTSEVTANMLDSWEWHRCRRAVGLRCKQVLKGQGAYGMATAYHKLRVQAAVLLGWKQMCRLCG